MSCYTCSENLCKITIDCDNKGIINLNQTAQNSGAYTVEMVFLNTTIKKEFTFNAGDNLEFEMPFLNEDYCYQLKLKYGGQYVHFPIGDKLVNTFNFCTQKEWIIS